MGLKEENVGLGTCQILPRVCVSFHEVALLLIFHNMDFSRLFKGAVQYFLKILRKWCLSVVELPVSMWTKL